MNSQAPPPLPVPNSAFRTYLRAVVLLVPTIFIWLFANIFLVPKLEQLWRDTGLASSKAQWLMNTSSAFQSNFYFVFAGIIVVFSLLEFRWAAWPHYRRTAVAFVTLFFHTAVLVGIATIATAALLAAPLLLKHK